MSEWFLFGAASTGIAWVAKRTIPRILPVLFGMNWYDGYDMALHFCGVLIEMTI